MESGAEKASRMPSERRTNPGKVIGKSASRSIENCRRQARADVSARHYGKVVDGTVCHRFRGFQSPLLNVHDGVVKDIVEIGTNVQKNSGIVAAADVIRKDNV